jgi:hypothetical protein
VLLHQRIELQQLPMPDLAAEGFPCLDQSSMSQVNSRVTSFSQERTYLPLALGTSS